MLEDILKQNSINKFSVDFRLSLTHTPSIIMNQVANYFKSEGLNVVHFPHSQINNYSLEEIEMLSMTYKLEHGEEDLISFISRYYRLGIEEWDLQEIKKGEKIPNGIQRIINYLATAYATPKDSVIIINHYEQGLHPGIVNSVMSGIMRFAQPKYLIATTYVDERFSFERNTDIRKLGKLLEPHLIV